MAACPPADRRAYLLRMVRTVLRRAALPLFALALLSLRASADPPPSSPAPLTGHWVISTPVFGVVSYYKMSLVQSGSAITGDMDGDTLTGTLAGSSLVFHAVDPKGGGEDATATLDHGVLSGSITFVFRDEKSPVATTFTARLIGGGRAAAKPRKWDFAPTQFLRQFSPLVAPVLTVNPGDTIATTTVDAGGVDAQQVHRIAGGNPQTGPFYVDGAMPGDTLVVHIDRLRLNRDYAISDDGIVPRAMTADSAVKLKHDDQRLDWHLDRARGVATSGAPGAHLKSYTVPVRPMLGCIATATPPGRAPPPTGDSGPFGGNLDFNEIVEGATVYLPVYNPGALLYFGDGHAAQGDGELTGDALETSLDVQVTVDVIHERQPRSPRVESPTRYIALGYDGSIDAAFAEATANMTEWLTERYALTPGEIAQVLGTAAEYHISEVADRNAGVALELAKDRLKSLALAQPPVAGAKN